MPAAEGVAELLGSTDSDDKLAQRYYIGDPGDFADIYSLSYSFWIFSFQFSIVFHFFVLVFNRFLFFSFSFVSVFIIFSFQF